MTNEQLHGSNKLDGHRSVGRRKVDPNEATISDLYDQLDTALDFVDCAYHAAVGLGHSDADGVRAVLDNAVTRLQAVKDGLSTMITWAREPS